VLFTVQKFQHFAVKEGTQLEQSWHIAQIKSIKKGKFKDLKSYNYRIAWRLLDG
jgi:hypothetical protein